MTNKMLKNIFFGTELEKLRAGTETTVQIIEQFLCKKLDADQRELIAKTIVSIARARHKGRFGGQITPGDMYFIGAFLALIKPDRMIELGVCSGQSSAFILKMSSELALLKSNEKFLTSLDLVEFFGPEKLDVGQVVQLNYPELTKNWDLRTGTTILEEQSIDKNSNESVIAFVDAEHRHPWPLIDVVQLSRLLPANAWIVIQDIQLTERWLANSIERGVECETPQRGVSYVFNHWPGTKFAGIEMCFNMAAIKNDITIDQRNSLLKVCEAYPNECKVKDLEKIMQNLTSIEL